MKKILLLVFALCLISLILIISNIPKTNKTNEYTTNSANIIDRKVLVIEFNPMIGDNELNVYKGWNNPKTLENSYIKDVNSVSSGLLNYQIVDRIEVNEFPIKKDKFVYSAATYTNCIATGNCHQPDEADYLEIINNYHVCDMVNKGEVDELWIWGGPYFGFYESLLTGPNGFFYNSLPLKGSGCNKLLPIMGFNYERGVSEMLENLGHRVEFTMNRVYEGYSNNSWSKFSAYDSSSKDGYQCGTIHFAPNSTADYDWDSKTYALSNCDSWKSYPDVAINPKSINCDVWGCDGYSYKKYWLSMLPKANGTTSGIYNNWWIYIADPNRIFK